MEGNMIIYSLWSCLSASEILALTQIDSPCAWKEIRLGFSVLFVLYHTYFPHPHPHSLLYMLTHRCTCILPGFREFHSA